MKLYHVEGRMAFMLESDTTDPEELRAELAERWSDCVWDMLTDGGNIEPDSITYEEEPDDIAAEALIS